MTSWKRASGLSLLLSIALAGTVDVSTAQSSDLESTLPGPIFVERAAAVGLDFVHCNGGSGEFYFPEIAGAGGALFDFDNDGDLDAYLAQSGSLGVREVCPQPPGGRLFRNDLRVDADGSRHLAFVDVTETAGIRTDAYGMGVAAADIDNDGLTDLYLTHYGPNQLFRNNGNGTFEDVTDAAGVGDSRWGTSAAFFDFDRDGFLDLFVANYVQFDLRENPECYATSSARDYCGPLTFPPERDVLFRNKGDGTFEDVSVPSNVANEAATGLGVVTADLNQDGWIDIYVANDGLPNHLWINQKSGVFSNEALFAGVAINWMGEAEAGMGVDAGDFDGDGDEDLFLSHLTDETNTLYVNGGNGLFEDRTTPSGLGVVSLPYTGFGAGWLDYDNDGWLDLLVVNGAVRRLDGRTGSHENLFAQPNQLLRNSGVGRFEDVSGRAGEALSLSEVSRGAAFGDVDNDGDTDVLVVNNGGPARLLVNEIGNGHHWVGLRLVGEQEHRDLLGARVDVVTTDGRHLWRRARADGSYASANDPRVLVGLGSSDVRTVTVHWPDGGVEAWDRIPMGRYATLTRGRGRRPE
ncbi:MAG TPA: CRTAC1 family protein [Vicinamibacteria bacterium]|nr:CRTAC1 family protein [Vicinamibacteria bacterium]